MALRPEFTLEAANRRGTGFLPELFGFRVMSIDEEKLTVFKQFIETLDIDDLGKGGTEHKLS